MTATDLQGAPPRTTCAPADRTMVSLAAVTWEFKLVGRSRMLTEAWQRAGRPTSFVQVPSLRTALQKLRSAPPAPHVLRPWPVAPARFWSRLGERRVRQLVAWPACELRRQLDRRIDWSHATALVVSPVWTPWLEHLPFAQVVYDCIDDLRVQTPRPELAPLYRKWEDELLTRADGAVASAQVLADDLRARRAHLPVTTVRNGVEFDRFAASASAPRPHDLPPPARPLIGFVGALYDWIDWPLIAATARAMPEAEFVFVGPVDGRSDPREAQALPNVRLLGPRAYRDVPDYMAHFDVCWVPFRHDAIAAAANPVKLYEYLALGKPTVSTPVADLDTFDGLVHEARSREQMVERLRGALHEREAAGAAARRVDFARRNSWDARAAQLAAFVDALHDGRIAARAAP